MHCNFRKRMQIEKAPANQEDIIRLTAGGANAHNTNKYILFGVHFLFGCVLSICSECVVKLRKLFFELSATIDIYILDHAHFLISNGSGSIFPPINFSHRIFFFF